MGGIGFGRVWGGGQSNFRGVGELGEVEKKMEGRPKRRTVLHVVMR